MPPVAITVTYAAVNGISLSKVRARSPAFIIGTAKKPNMTTTGVGTKTIRGIHLVKYKSTIATPVTGRVRRAEKNIKETYVSGYILIPALSS